MPMSGDILGTQIAAAVKGLSDSQKTDLNEVWKAVAKAIVTHLTTTAVVTTTGTAAAQTGTIS